MLFEFAIAGGAQLLQLRGEKGELLCGHGERKSARELGLRLAALLKKVLGAYLAMGQQGHLE